MMSHTNQQKNIEISGSSALLSGLGVDPSQLLPYLAAEGRPIPAIRTDGEAIDSAENGMLEQAGTDGASSLGDLTSIPQQAGSRIVVAPTATPPAGALAPTRSSLPQFDQTELARSLAPFSADALPLSLATSSGVRNGWNTPSIGASPNASRSGFSNWSSYNAATGGRVESGFSFGTSDTVPQAWTQPAEFSVDTGSTSSSAAGDTSAIETRLARAVERLERIAEQLEQPSAAGRSGASRSFRGRIDE